MADRKETREEALDRLLTERGYPPRAAGDETARGLEGSKLGSRAPIRALARRGWIDWFDAECDFHLPGRHAEVVTRLLGRVSVDAAVTDSWVPRHGRVITVSRDGARRGFLAPIPDRPGTNSLDTGDQTACLAWIPAEIHDAVARFVRVAEDLDAPGYPRPRALEREELDALLATARKAEAREDAARRKLEPERIDRLPPPSGAGVQIRSQEGLNEAGVCPALEAIEPPLVLALTAERVASGCPCVLGGRIFFAASEIDKQGSRIVVRALDERDGTELWVRQVAESTSTECSLFATGDRLVVNAGTYESLVLDPDSGEVLARHPVALWGEHAVVEGGICGVIPRPAEGGEDRHDLGLWSPATGAWAWKTPVDVMPWWSRTSMAAGIVVTQVTDTAIAGFDARDGRERWRLDVGEIGRHTDDMRKTVDGTPGSIAIVDTEPAPLVIVRG